MHNIRNQVPYLISLDISMYVTPAAVLTKYSTDICRSQILAYHKVNIHQVCRYLGTVTSNLNSEPGFKTKHTFFLILLLIQVLQPNKIYYINRYKYRNDITTSETQTLEEFNHKCYSLTNNLINPLRNVDRKLSKFSTTVPSNRRDDVQFTKISTSHRIKLILNLFTGKKKHQRPIKKRL